MLTMVGYCWLCHQNLYFAHHGICCICQRQLKRLQKVCPRCALPAEAESISCGRCLKRPPPWQQLVALTDYAPPLSQLIQRYKYHSTPQLAPVLARLFLLHWQQGYREGRWHKPDYILGIPLHRKKRWQRGFDHIELMTYSLSHWLQCTHRPDLLQRSRATLTQRGLSATQRKTNLKNAFQLQGDFVDQHVAIFDDVITTGTTLREASQLLIRAGARSVQAWAICRTL
ncbi:DNA utilization protein GntX [Xenorhabdus sp. 42]|uniref:DNA utilization protein GntX n=1 Tax=Xenorhabdus szentirmaii TaxID=290112 RepID=UPI000C046940|nr:MULTISPECIES: DNA utilization protein GntX [Xenorhabdus]MBD2780280.1 DNA utilization protein GntX [Xenorhabdus sp. 38]MBD2804880.1 DNA utilization protein GntX [Xenorhabdus sp. ZM]MBD2820664.1 DNA utilization protein GntX [Xenorhabdus sp. 42]PHM43315.1 competence protein ComF [Xenorhabdus szentirmaii]